MKKIAFSKTDLNPHKKLKCGVSKITILIKNFCTLEYKLSYQFFIRQWFYNLNT